MLAPLAQSESKKRFFERLHLNPDEPMHRKLYSMMKAEAVEGRSRIASSEEALIPSLRNDPKIEPPYSNAQISEAATQQEILRIYDRARPETKPYYELGRDTDRMNEDNWIIRWMLWHVNRYRDNRNHHKKKSSPSPSTARSSTSPTTETPQATTSSRPYWDPVRNS